MAAGDFGMTPGRAKLALILLVVMLVAVQYGGVSLGHYYGYRLSGIADSYWQWNHYMSDPPDVLFVGDSRVREDVDLNAVEGIVAGELGRSVRVGKIGFDSAQPRNLLALVYRVTHFAKRPRLVLFGMSEYQYSNAYNFDPTYDFWNMSLPPDLGFYQLAFEIDTGNQGRLLTGYIDPLGANQKVLETGIPCTVHDLKRLIATNTPIKPADALAPLSNCDTPYSFANLTMTAAARDRIYAQYRQIFATNYSYSQTQDSYVRRAAAMARAAGVALAFFVPPEYHLEDLNPAAYSEFHDRTASLAAALGARRYDFHSEFGDSMALWADPAHLNGKGAFQLAPQLASMIQQELAGP